MWHGDTSRTTDVPNLYAGPITRARAAATLAVALRGQQNPKWVVCMFSVADAQIAVCDLERLPGPEALIRPADCVRIIFKTPWEWEHHAPLLQARLKDNARAAKPGVWRAAALPADLELQLAVPSTVYRSLQALCDQRWGGKPNRQIGATHGQEWLQADAQRDAVRGLGPAPTARAPDASAPGRALAAQLSRWPTYPSTWRQKAPSANRCRSLRQRGPRNPQSAPNEQTSSTQAGQCWNTWRDMRCTPPPRRKTRRRPPISSRDGHGGHRGCPVRPAPLFLPQANGNVAAPEGEEEAADTAPRAGGAARQGSIPAGLAPLWPPPWERAPHTPWPHHIPGTWRPQRTPRQCR